MLISDEANSQAGTGTLVVHLLGKCNLTCSHCYMEGAPSRRERLSLDAVLDAIGECPRLGIGQLYVTGGEPLLYPGLAEVLASSAMQPGMQVTVCTNATLLSDRWASMLGKWGVKVNVSIDGTPDFHDAFRGKPGAFAASERGIEAVVAVGCKLTIIATISQTNLHMLSWLFNRAMAWKAETFRVQPLLRLGRGETIAEQRLTAAQIDRLILELSDLANRNRSAIRCGLIGQSRRFLESHPCGAYVCNGAGCHRRVAKEIKKIVIREDGTVLPEATNLSHVFAIGRLGEAPLGDLVDRYFAGGYELFDRLCRSAYSEIMPAWSAAIVPWDQIIAERSQSWGPNDTMESSALGCTTCGPHMSAAPVH